MKVVVEIHDAQIVASLQEAIRIRMHEFFKQHPDDIAECIRICTAMNDVIRYFDGTEVDIGMEIGWQRKGNAAPRADEIMASFDRAIASLQS